MVMVMMKSPPLSLLSRLLVILIKDYFYCSHQAGSSFLQTRKINKRGLLKVTQISEFFSETGVVESMGYGCCLGVLAIE